MSKLIEQFARPSRAVRRLFATPRRRGSVLILCVVLIVVLALIGTAMLSGARIDRYTVQQHSYNTQIELLVEGAKQVAKSVVVQDLYDTTVANAPPVYRPPFEQSVLLTPPPTMALTTYDHYDGYHIPDPTVAPPPVEPYDDWLASLVPQPTSTGAGSQIYWPAVTAPISSSTGAFEAPDLPQAGATFTVRSYLVPSFKTISYPDGSQQMFPALAPIDVTTGAVGNAILAADADGDGIADSFLSRLLPGELNGVTWYVGYRIVDNAAKINVNTALSRSADFDHTGNALPADRFTRYFTSSVGLLEMLRTWDTTETNVNAISAELVELNEHRFGGQIYPEGIVNGTGQPIDDAGAARGDFSYTSLGDAMFNGLGRRLGNPGYSTATFRWRPYDIGNMISLLAGFTLLKPEVSQTTLETALQQSLYLFAANGPNGQRNGMRRYSPNQATFWFNENFDYDNERNVPGTNFDATTFMPLRALLATHSPVSNYVPQHTMEYVQGPAPFEEMNPRGIRPAHKTTNPVGSPNLMPDYSTGTGTMATATAKTNVNTAEFGELWRAYWNVMTDHTTPVSYSPTFNGGTPFTTPGGDYGQLLWKGNGFDPFTGVPTTGLAEEHPQQMFRSSLRDLQGAQPQVFFPPYQQLLLRAAIAAVNTEDLRDPDHDPTVRSIPLVAMVNGTATNVQVLIGGTEPQPFITEVYVNTQNSLLGGGSLPANPKGYVAIELYNPYPVEINLRNWALAMIDRRQPDSTEPAVLQNKYPNPAAPMNQKGLSYFYIHEGVANTAPDTDPLTYPTPPYTFPDTATVPPYGYLVLENLDRSGTATNVNADAASTPPYNAVPANSLYVPNLHWVVRDTNALAQTFKEHRGGELVLLRPIGTAMGPSWDPPGLEHSNVLPVDSFDFTGMFTPERYQETAGTPVPPPTYFSWHYIRSSAAPGGADQPNWRFVYPGRYQGDTSTLRHQGTVEHLWEDPQDDPRAASGAVDGMGSPDATASYPTIHTIQLAAAGFPGPNPVTAPAGNLAPFGGFARNGDILQVTYIGSYRVAFAGDIGSTLEINAVTLDSCFANDTDADAANPAGNNDEPLNPTMLESREQVGRFVPLVYNDPTGVPLYNDLDPTGDFNRDSTMTGNKWRYRWAIDLFDYLTVHSPGNDYLPDVPTTSPPYTPQREPVDNDGDGTFGDVDITTATPDRGPGVEDHVPMHGLININTAPAKVLSALPWLPTGDNWAYAPATDAWAPGQDGEEDNYTLAKALVHWRDGTPPPSPIARPGNGPFTTLFDLHRVPAFINLQAALINSLPNGPDDAEGDFSPHNAAPATVPPTPPIDAVRYDFEEQYLLLNRVSNLITTRSDSFTVYLVVQGWRNVGTATPELVAQRRVAFIQDRSPVRPQQPSLPSPVNVPND